MTDYAIVVGINLYPGISPLEGAQRDADEFAAWLTLPEGGGVDPANVVRLTTARFHPPLPARASQAQPTADQFRDTFTEIVTDGAGRVRTPAGRRLTLYFSGHGFMGNTTAIERAVYSANATTLAPDHIAATRYANWAVRAGLFDEMVLICDACADLSLTTSIAEPILMPLVNAARAARVRTFYAYASPAGAKARERPLGADKQVRGIFSYLLLEALRQAPGADDGCVMATHVRDYIHNAWPETAGADILPPTIAVEPARDLLMARRPPTDKQPATTVTITAVGAGSAELVVLGGNGKACRTATLTDGQAEVSLPAGLYKAVVQGTARSTLFQAIGEVTRVDIP